MMLSCIGQTEQNLTVKCCQPFKQVGTGMQCQRPRQDIEISCDRGISRSDDLQDETLQKTLQVCDVRLLQVVRTHPMCLRDRRVNAQPSTAMSCVAASRTSTKKRPVMAPTSAAARRSCAQPAHKTSIAADTSWMGTCMRTHGEL